MASKLKVGAVMKTKNLTPNQIHYVRYRNQILEALKKDYTINKPKYQRRSRKYYLKNKSKIIISNKKWANQNKEKVAEYLHRYYLKKKCKKNSKLKLLLQKLWFVRLWRQVFK